MPKLLESTVARTKVPPGKRDVLVFDDAVPGFFLRKFASGKASYGVKYSIGTKQRRLSLGPAVPGALADARRKAADVLAKARLGDDVQEAKRAARERKSATVGDLVPRFLTARADDWSASYLATTQRYLTDHWRPLHRLAVEEVTRKDTVRVLDEIADARGRVTADRARAALSSFYAWAIDRGYADMTPVQHIRSRANGGSRDRVLSEVELAQVWHAVEGMGDYADIVRLLILTAQRRNEIADLSWPEVDFAREQLNLPGERTKNGRPHIVPLSKPALAILQDVPRRNSREFLFGEGERGYQGWSKSKRQLDAKLPAGMPGWTLHDIRRSVVTHLSENGFAAPHVVEAIVNHVSGHKASVAGIYNKSVYAAEKRAALDAWGAHVMKLVAKSEAEA